MTRMKCERCGKRMRQTLTFGIGKSADCWVQPWSAETGLNVAEFDEDMCDRCEEQMFADSEAESKLRDAEAAAKKTLDGSS